MSEYESFQEAKKRIRHQNESQIYSSLGKKSYGKTRQTSLKKKKEFQNTALLNIAINLLHVLYIVMTQILTVKYLI